MLALGSWYAVKDGDMVARSLWLRHYSAKSNAARRPVGSERLFVGPGGKLVLMTADSLAVFAWRLARYRCDGEIGVECTLFRNESPLRASDLIREASDLAWCRWPGERLFTFVNPSKIRSTNPGFCFLEAGWTRLKRCTKTGLRILEKLPE